MTKKESTSIYLDAELKNQCQELFDDIGMYITTAVTIFLQQCLRVRGLPFPASQEVPNADTNEAFNEFEAIKNHPEFYPHYDSFSDAVKNL